jgi:hypothetical protein
MEEGDSAGDCVAWLLWALVLVGYVEMPLAPPANAGRIKRAALRMTGPQRGRRDRGYCDLAWALRISSNPCCTHLGGSGLFW